VLRRTEFRRDDQILEPDVAPHSVSPGWTV
jgi:hypothetical protein